jgi:hypothetical protein
MTKLQAVIEAARRLTPKLKRQLAGETETGLSHQWIEEIDRRIADIDAGRARLIPADEVFHRSSQILKRCTPSRPASKGGQEAMRVRFSAVAVEESLEALRRPGY